MKITYDIPNQPKTIMEGDNETFTQLKKITACSSIIMQNSAGLIIREFHRYETDCYQDYIGTGYHCSDSVNRFRWSDKLDVIEVWEFQGELDGHEAFIVANKFSWIDVKSIGNHSIIQMNVIDNKLCCRTYKKGSLSDPKWVPIYSMNVPYDISLKCEKTVEKILVYIRKADVNILLKNRLIEMLTYAKD